MRASIHDGRNHRVPRVVNPRRELLLSLVSYRRIARAYEPLAAAYSGGGIPRCKASQIRHLAPGDRVLYAGAGAGEDAALALARGALVTLVDQSTAMLTLARRNLGRTLDAADLERLIVLREDIMAHDRPGDYDVVVANFFLNVFSPARMPEVVQHLASLLRPGGRLMLADFAPGHPSRWIRGLQQLYYGPPLLLFWALTNNAWHGLYDYGPAIEAASLTIEWRRSAPIFGLGPRWLETLCARREPSLQGS